MTIIDTPYNTTSKISSLLSKGVKTVIRYYNFSNSSTLKDKRLELAEAEVLSANGLSIAVTFQQRQNQIDDFSESKGIAAGHQAYRYARDHIGQPAGSAIYFSVDFDADSSAINTNVQPYFKGVQQAFNEESAGNPQYRIGAYGSGLVCTTLSDNNLIELTWLAMSRGFLGTKEALKSGRYHLSQLAPEAKLGGLDVDFNEINPAYSEFGEFTIATDSSVLHQNFQAGEKYRVVTRNRLNLRGGVGTNFNVIGSLHSGQIVFVKSINNGWASIDLEGDGKTDGFSSIDFLDLI